MAIEYAPSSWLSSWPDAVAFVLGLAVAWVGGWNTGDLVWSLWLSSIVVGYATIVWMIGQPAVELAWAGWRDRKKYDIHVRQLIALWSVILFGLLIYLGFYTIHFVGFHFGQSWLLLSFFPVNGGGGSGQGHLVNADWSTYLEIMRRYWFFLPSAFLTHRAAFARTPISSPRLLGKEMGELFAQPYKNIMRMQMLIFFFFLAHFAGLEDFAVYTAIYAVYFFPWRSVRRPATEPESAIS